MTIVIQHSVWDWKVEDVGFSDGLSSGGVPSTLRVPFAAVTQFHDPAVEFSLTFHADAAPELHEEHEVPENDSPQAESGDAAEAGETADDGSNVVSVDFTRKK